MKTFNDIFAWAESFCIKFCMFIGNLYPRMRTDFRLFILTFNEMALILSRAPIISFLRFQVWIVHHQGVKFQSISLMEMKLLANGVDSTADFLNKA